MPKMKSKSGAKKRFKITASGKIKRYSSHASHLQTKKSAKRKRHLRQADVVSPADARRIKRLIVT